MWLESTNDADAFLTVQVDQVGNLAGVVRIDDCGALSFTTFSAQPHPDVKPMACKCTYQIGCMCQQLLTLSVLCASPDAGNFFGGMM